MKHIITLFVCLSTFITPVSAALPVILNSGDPATCGPGGQAGNNLTNPIGNTIYDSYYTSECFYAAQSDHVISDPGIVAGTSSTLYLHFAEIFFGSGNPNSSGGDGSRIFHVDVEGTRILENFDVHGNVGASNAAVYRYDFVATTNGSVTVSFIPVIQNAKVSAIEIRTLGEASDLPPTTPIIDLTNPVFPVEWMDVSGRIVNDQALISWSTAWEQSNAGFEVQMAVRGEAYKPMAFVEGAGTTQEVKEYAYQSPLLQPGIYLFRLKQIDFDGMVSISSTIELSVGNQSGSSILSLFPNPATESSVLTFFGFEGEPYTVSVINQVGQEIIRINGEMKLEGVPSDITLDLSSLAAGLYTVSAYSAGEIDVKKLIVR